MNHGEDSKVEYESATYLSIQHMLVDNDDYSASTFIDLYSTSGDAGAIPSIGMIMTASKRRHCYSRFILGWICTRSAITAITRLATHSISGFTETTLVCHSPSGFCYRGEATDHRFRCNEDGSQKRRVADKSRMGNPRNGMPSKSKCRSRRRGADQFKNESGMTGVIYRPHRQICQYQKWLLH